MGMNKALDEGYGKEDFESNTASMVRDAAMGKGEDELFERKLTKEEKKAAAKVAREAKKKAREAKNAGKKGSKQKNNSIEEEKKEIDALEAAKDALDISGAQGAKKESL